MSKRKPLNSLQQLNNAQGDHMKKLLYIAIAIISFNAVPYAFADDALPEIAPVDDPAPPPLDAPAAE